MDETRVDKTVVDETGVDKLGCYHTDSLHSLAEIDLTGDWERCSATKWGLRQLRFDLLYRCHAPSALWSSVDICWQNIQGLPKDVYATFHHQWFVHSQQFMPCYHPRPERTTTGCLHTSRKNYKIEACRWVHRAWWLISCEDMELLQPQWSMHNQPRWSLG